MRCIRTTTRSFELNAITLKCCQAVCRHLASEVSSSALHPTWQRVASLASCVYHPRVARERVRIAAILRRMSTDLGEKLTDEEVDEEFRENNFGDEGAIEEDEVFQTGQSLGR